MRLCSFFNSFIKSVLLFLIVILAGCSGGSSTGNGGDEAQSMLKPYKGDETTFELLRGGANQFLLPVEVGNQTLKFLVDTGSNALLVFEDRIAAANDQIERTSTQVSKAYSSTIREGIVALAPIRIGAYEAQAMQIMLIQSPNSRNDPSLTAKGADGVIGLRRTNGLGMGLDDVLLDVPLSAIKPPVNDLELNLPSSGPASLTFGGTPIQDAADPSALFQAKTLSLLDPTDNVTRSFSDLQVPFRARSSAGEADDENLDILLDTGAVSKLVLDTRVAEKLGYDASSHTWSIPADEEIELNLIGPETTLGLRPKFKVSEIKVAPYSTLGVEFEAVLGISRWQEYVVGFSFVDYQSGGPDGTITLLPRDDVKAISDEGQNRTSGRCIELLGLNSIGDDRFPSTDYTGSTIAFQSNRSGGEGGWDIYVWNKEEGLLDLPGLNTPGEDADPSISGDGRYLTFHSNREGGFGGFDVYLYDIEKREYISTDGVNTEALERNAVLSGDGKLLAFRSDRAGGQGGSDIYLYDIEAQTLVDLPGLNSAGGDYDPSLSYDGRYLAFHYHAGMRLAVVERDVGVYDVLEKKKLFIPAEMSTPANEMAAAISPDGGMAIFTSNRDHSEMGLYNRDFIAFDLSGGMAVYLPGLNSVKDENGATFTGDGQALSFHSQRSGGVGGSDIYLYSLSEPAQAEPGEGEVPASAISLKKTTDGLFTIPVEIGGKTVDLLLDSSFTGMVLFSDRLPLNVSVTHGEGKIALNLVDGAVEGFDGSANVAVGDYAASNFGVVFVDSREYAAASGLSLLGAKGVFGMRFKRAPGDVVDVSTGQDADGVDIPLAALQPVISMIELNLDPEGAAGLSFGSGPITSHASADVLFTMAATGIISEIDPVNLSFTDLEVPFLLASEDIVVGEDENILLSTALTDQLVIDKGFAELLGYDVETESWTGVVGLDLYLTGVFSTLPIGDFSVDKITVKDLGDADYAAILGLNAWQQYVLLFDMVDYQGGGPRALLSLLDRDEITSSGGEGAAADSRFVALPGLNSIADDTYGDISSDGKTIVFQSTRQGGQGGIDVYVYKMGTGLLELEGLNSSASDVDPSVNGDGTLVAFHSDRSGNYDIYLYDVANQRLIDLPGLNSEYLERNPDLSADGKLLAFRSERPHGRYNATDSNIYVYDLTTQALLPLPMLNTSGMEYDPSLDEAGEYLSFHARYRDDSQGGRDVYLYDMANQELVDLPRRINSEFTDAATAISSDGGFIAFHSEKGSPELANAGRDIFLFEAGAGEFLTLPGINSRAEDSAPSLSKDAEYILFHSKRANTTGGYDLYLYKRN